LHLLCLCHVMELCAVPSAILCTPVCECGFAHRDGLSRGPCLRWSQESLAKNLRRTRRNLTIHLLDSGNSDSSSDMGEKDDFDTQWTRRGRYAAVRGPGVPKDGRSETPEERLYAVGVHAVASCFFGRLAVRYRFSCWALSDLGVCLGLVLCDPTQVPSGSNPAAGCAWKWWTWHPQRHGSRCDGGDCGGVWCCVVQA